MRKRSMFQVGSFWGFSRSLDLQKVGCAEKSWCESVKIACGRCTEADCKQKCRVQVCTNSIKENIANHRWADCCLSFHQPRKAGRIETRTYPNRYIYLAGVRWRWLKTFLAFCWAVFEWPAQGCWIPGLGSSCASASKCPQLLQPAVFAKLVLEKLFKAHKNHFQN
jgi:hypothetical protein